MFLTYLLNFDHLLLYTMLGAGLVLIHFGEFTPQYFFLQPLGFVSSFVVLGSHLKQCDID